MSLIILYSTLRYCRLIKASKCVTDHRLSSSHWTKPTRTKLIWSTWKLPLKKISLICKERWGKTGQVCVGKWFFLYKIFDFQIISLRLKREQDGCRAGLRTGSAATPWWRDQITVRKLTNRLKVPRWRGRRVRRESIPSWSRVHILQFQVEYPLSRTELRRKLRIQERRRQLQ